MSMFGERLRLLRKKKGLSQSELAEELGVAMDTVSIWELGKRMPEEKTIKRIALYFETSVEYLMGESDLPDLDSMIAELRRLKGIPEEADEYGSDVIWLSDTEQRILEMYRDLSIEKQKEVFEVINQTYESEKGTDDSTSGTG